LNKRFKEWRGKYRARRKQKDWEQMIESSQTQDNRHEGLLRQHSLKRFLKCLYNFTIRQRYAEQVFELPAFDLPAAYRDAPAFASTTGYLGINEKQTDVNPDRSVCGDLVNKGVTEAASVDENDWSWALNFDFDTVSTSSVLFNSLAQL
jgi:hypothetical protein